MREWRILTKLWLMTSQGHHIILDLYGCEPYVLDDYDYLYEVMTDAMSLANAHLLNLSGHKFEPQGVTLLALLAESHASIHTWPQEEYAALDVYTCGENMNTRRAVEYWKEKLQAKTAVERELLRSTSLNS
jgi:S-adenosylmethionine decarboxylase